MAEFFGKQQIEIPCPKCKSKFKKTIAELKRPDVKCPKCGLPIETSDFKRGIDKAEQSIRDLQKELKDLNRRLK